MLLRTNNDNAFLIGILVSILLLIIFNQVIFSINGIRIKDNKVRIIAKYKIRTFNYDDIDKVEVVPYMQRVEQHKTDREVAPQVKREVKNIDVILD